MRRPGSSSRSPKWDAPTRPSAASRCSTRSTTRSTKRRPNATAPSPMSWRPTSIRPSDKAGRGGWTWYTGSAGWLYRAAVESILGIRKEGSRLTVTPVLPSHWDGYQATLRLSDAVYRIRVVREKGIKNAAIEIDGERREGSSIETQEQRRDRSVGIDPGLTGKNIHEVWPDCHYFAARPPFFLSSQPVRRSRDVTDRCSFLFGKVERSRLSAHCLASRQPVRQFHGAVHNFV